MLKRIYPKIIAMRKEMVGVVIIGVFLILSLILWNIYQATNKQKNNKIKKIAASKVSIANNSEVLWYKNQIDKKTKTLAQEPKQLLTAITTSENATLLSQNPKTLLEDQEYQKAKIAAIGSNQININLTGGSAQISSDLTEREKDSATTSYSEREIDQNKQAEKIAFIKENENLEKNYLNERLQAPISPYEIKAGTIIPGILISGINSDLPGQIIAQVRSNVYDSATGKYLLVPQGAKIIGLYDSQIVYGQKRVLVIWKRIIFSNGTSISLEGMPGADLSGYAGFNDKVNNHYAKMLGSVILLSVLSAGAELSQPQESDDNNELSVSQTLASSLGTNISDLATSMINKDLNIQPTLEIRPGYLFNISVTKDIVFPGSYEK